MRHDCQLSISFVPKKIGPHQTSMANSSKSPQAGAACGRATWPFREKIREIFNAPLRMNSAWKTTSLVERIGGEEFSMGALPVIRLASATRVSMTRRKTGRVAFSSCRKPSAFRCRSTSPRCGAPSSVAPRWRTSYQYLTARIVSSEIFSAMVVVECSSGMPSGISSSPVQYVQRWIGEKMMEGSPWSWATTT